MALNQKVTLELNEDACLVLFELLTRSYEAWRKTNPNDNSPNPLVLEAREISERRALWILEGALERTLPVFASNYLELLSEAKKALEAPR